MSDKKKNIWEQFCYYIEKPTLRNRKKAFDEAYKLSVEDRSAVWEMLRIHPVSKDGAPKNGFLLAKQMIRCVQVHARVHGCVIPDVELTNLADSQINLPKAPTLFDALVSTSTFPGCRMAEPMKVKVGFRRRTDTLTGVCLDLDVDYEGSRGFSNKSFENDYYAFREDVDHLRISNPDLYWYISGLDLRSLRTRDYAKLGNLLEPAPTQSFQVGTTCG